jgi:hypothetical protein
LGSQIDFQKLRLYFAMFMEGFGTSRTFSCTKSGERGDSKVVN